VWRVGVLLLVALVLQLAFISQTTLLGTNLDVMPIVVVSVALLAGPVAGSVVGFAAGLLVDMALVQTLGVTSLVLIAVGYVGGRYRELRDTSHGLVPVFAGAAATLFYAAGLALIQFLLGVESSVSALVIRDAFVQALLSALVAIPLFSAIRWLLGPRKRRPATRLRITPIT
jgi:rod shape-determining protein MreD